MRIVVVRSSKPGCEPKCAEWISAEGDIVLAAAEQLRKVVNSLGGGKLPGNAYDFFIYLYRGNAYEKKGNLDRAIADYSKVIEIDPKYAPAYAKRGAAYEKKRDHDRAIADFNKAIEINSKYAQVDR
jgi:tetratricopeptide (TPR) repeat protein